MTKWYYRIDEISVGPVTGDKIKELIKAGEIKPETLVKIEAWPDWKTAAEAGLFTETAPSPKVTCTLSNSALILGILSWVLPFCGFVLGLAGIIVGITALYKIKQGTAKAPELAYAGIGCSSITVGSVIVAIIVQFFWGTKAVEVKQYPFCTENLNKIATALKNYANDNDDYFPPYSGAKGLELLRANNYITDDKIFICRYSNCKATPDNTSLKEESLSYVYYGGFKNISGNKNVLILRDKDGNHENFGHVLYCDGHVERVNGKNWQDKLKTSEKNGAK